MSTQVEATTVELSPKVLPLLDSIAGDTPDQKIVHLLLGAVRDRLEACEREQLELEIKYGLEYEGFRRKLEAGELGDEFGYALETDAMRWDDLVAEKRHWLQQLGLLLE
jgi:hypothetical protein